MKKIAITLMLAVSCLFGQLFAQEKITVALDQQGQIKADKENLSMKKTDLKNVVVTASDNIAVTAEGILSNGSREAINLAQAANVFTLDWTQVDKKDKYADVRLIYKLSGKPDKSTTIAFSKATTTQTFDDFESIFRSSSDIDPRIRAQFAVSKRYNAKENIAYFFLDNSGKILGKKPVNIDEDDNIKVYMLVRRSERQLYTIEAIGTYEPTDLAIRSYEPVADIKTVSESGDDDPWIVVTEEFGPFTSENITLNVRKKEGDGETSKILNTYTIKINDLYHVAVGASFVKTSLENPDFTVAPVNGGSENTIVATNTGDRTMFTFNVIWYWWGTIKYLFKGDDITRGRDVLKEPNFLTRINPTFGVSLDSDFKENFFLGGTFEFARGGSITFGGHYGRVTKLLDTDFKLGETVFTGTEQDIKTTGEWKWGTYVGITLDTRIFNKLFRRQ